MASTALPISPAAPSTGDAEVSLFRLYLLRALYLLLVVGGGLTFLPQLFDHEPAARGIIPSLLCGIWALGLFGLRYPLQLLPVLLLELVWKMIWLIAFALPQWMSGNAPPTFAGDFGAIAFAPLLFVPIIPWRYVWRHYVTRPGDRWSARAIQE